MTNTWKRCPSTSVKVSWAPGCGSSRRAIIRNPAARPVPSNSVDEVGDLGDFGVVAQLGAVGGDRRLPRPFGHVDQHGCDVDGELVADHEPHVAVPAVVDEAV